MTTTPLSGTASPPATQVASEETTPYARRWRALPGVLIAMFMAQFDLYVVNVAVPLLQHDLGASQGALELIVAGYAFMYASGLVLGGRLGDLLGHRRMFLYGMVAFAAASLLCGLAQSADQLVGTRLLQGLTAAAMVPQVLALITDLFPAAERAKALSWFGVTIGVGAVAGQVLGGVLLDVNLFGLGWRVIFLVNVIVGLVTVVLGVRLVPQSKSKSKNRPGLDPIGAIGISGSLALLLVPLALGRTQGWPVWTWASMAAAVPAMVATLLWERALKARDGQPLLVLELFKERAFSLGLVVNICVFAAFFSFVFTLTLVMQVGLGLTPLQAGGSFAPLGVAFALASIMAKRFISIYGSRVITVGSAIAALGLIVMFFLLHASGSSTNIVELIGPMVVVGLGNGIAVPALVGSVLAGVRSGNAGAAAGVLTTSQQFASAVGVTGLGSVFFAVLGSRSGIGGYTAALQWTVACSVILALSASALSTLLPTIRKLSSHAPK